MARKAVAQFETYKQRQLPEIRAKEQAYFDQTAYLLTRLAERMPIAAASKQAFLHAMGLDHVPGAIVHRQDVSLQRPLTTDQLTNLRADGGPALAFSDKASRHERSLYLAIAGGTALPAGVSFYQVMASHLRSSVGPALFDKIAPALNRQYLDQVTPRLDGHQPLLAQLAQRGLVLERMADSSIRVGHHLTERDAFVVLPPALANRLQGLAIPALDHQRATLQTGIGRNLVSLQQALDLSDTKRVSLLVGHYTRLLAKSYTGHPGTMPVPTADSMLAQLSGRFTKQLLQPAEQKPERLAQTNRQPPLSAYAQRVVTLLQQAAITPLERGQLAIQLGLRWQTGGDGSLRVVEGKEGPSPGASYTLTPQQRALVINPGGSEKSSLHTGEADRLLLRSQLSGKPLAASGILPWQLARLNLPLLGKLLPNPAGSTQEAGRVSLHPWYHSQRGAQIIVDTAAQHGEAATARRYLTSLFQRGFLVEQQAGEPGQPARYRMGHYQADRRTYVPVPALLAQILSAGLVADKKGAVLLVEPAWPAPNTAQARHMMKLSSLVDGDRGSDAVNKTLAAIHQQYPGLRSISQPQAILDTLATQFPQREKTISISLGGKGAGVKAGVGTEKGDTQLENMLDELEQKTTQQSHKGFLDVLGESGTLDSPKKKRIGEEVRHRLKRR